MSMKKLLKKLALLIAAVFILMNVVAYIHAYRFTHFSTTATARTKDPTELTILDKLKVLFTGIANPRPLHQTIPSNAYETFSIASSEKLECWRAQVRHAKGTVIMFHGYAGEKSSLLERAEIFQSMGFNTILVDFGGSGGSAGNSTTIGFDEAQQVKDCYDFIAQQSEPIILFGTSMGAAAILKAIDDYKLNANAVILECPFGSLAKTVSARFTMMNVPPFPMSTLLTFWGGVQHGYWAFGHNPISYAKSVSIPTLILYGEQDERVTLEESQEIYKNLNGPKRLVTYPHAGHNVFLVDNQTRWKKDVTDFLHQYSSR
ncbi:alpha/beta hydrolase [Pseudochryseolinea flava]|uniref:Alpha/beta hydrolase n=1 Tax=Pseudochryseolinea flava TaxID=2059302 RepID=A0A364Y942_9BACT|nr:alpha/beta fold hydrolase [Pseudochryseolinea flava]RAW02762.1 alpha/beta hydrolase [Pseudochryseolinea flava]